MPLDKTALKSAMIAAFTANLPGITADQTTALDTTCGAIADAIDTYVKAIQITYTSGLTTATGGGPVTGTMVYTIS